MEKLSHVTENIIDENVERLAELFPEVVTEGETGYLVPLEQLSDGTGTPVDPEKFVGDLRDALVRMVSDPERARVMGEASRRRAAEHFAWTSIAERTLEVYRTVIAQHS